MTRCAATILALILALMVLASPAAAAEPRLYAGVGQADITPQQTGYFLGGWTLAYRVALGQSTRLYANALVLRSGNRKLALVESDLFAIFAGLQSDVAAQVADLGFDRASVVLGASHTHSGPGGFASNPTYNDAAPDATPQYVAGNPQQTAAFFFSPAPADPQLYTFLVHRIALAIRRANANLGPALAGWGHSELVGITQNRSLEAHLANFGVFDPTYGSGSVSQDPGGYADTIDPSVDVLRVDKLVRRAVRCGVSRPRCLRAVDEPIGAWSTFADHGTVVHSNYEVYSGDHLGVAWRVLDADIRRAGHVPARQPVIDVYPNADEGDQTAALQHLGPSGADLVGRAEAAKMFAAWRAAGHSLSPTAPLDERFTVTCFCGRQTASGPVATQGQIGLPFLTGAPEGRGPLYDRYGINFSGTRSPLSIPPQGDKVVIPAGSFPGAVPVSVIRIGDGAIAAIPGEATAMAGRGFRRAVLAALRPLGVRQVAIGGLTDDYINYITTPAEYGWQSYEGGSTLFGRSEATFLQERLVELAGDIARGSPAPAPYPIDQFYGVHADGPPYPAGAISGTITAEPGPAYPRLGHVQLSWDGGPKGHDRPLDRPFVQTQRLRRGRWATVDSDLGLNMLWRVDDQGHYSVEWEVPLSAPTGSYRLLVTASRYTLASRPFRVTRYSGLQVTPVPVRGALGVRLGYPAADPISDLTSRPPYVSSGTVTFVVDGRRIRLRNPAGSVVAIITPPRASVRVPVGGARDSYGNTNSAALTLR